MPTSSGRASTARPSAVAESFDAYREWLGMRSPNRPPGYYQLLDLDEFEDDPQRIVMAADAALARVRKIRPKDQAKRWQTLLDEITLAKLCLSDPARKSQYDRQLRSAGGSSAAQITRERVAVNPDLLPPGAAPIVANPVVAAPAPAEAIPLGNPAGAAQPSAWPTISPAAAVPVAMVATAVVAAEAEPVAKPAERATQPGQITPFIWPKSLTAPGADTAVEEHPDSAPVESASVGPVDTSVKPSGAAPLLRPVPISSAAAGDRSAGPVSIAPWPAAAGLPVSNGSSRQFQMLIGAGIVALIALTLIVLRSFGTSSPAEPDGTANTRLSASTANSAESDARPADNRANADRVRQQHPQDTEPEPAESEPAAVAAEKPKTAKTKRPKPARTPKPQREAQPVDEPKVVETPPAPPTEVAQVNNPTEEQMPPVDPKQSAAFAKSIAVARGALAARDVPQALKEIAAADRLAQSAEEHTQAARVKILAGYVDGFWNAVRESLKGLQAADELKINNTVAAVVDAGPDGITLHMGGRNLEYKLNNLPAGLAMTLAQRWFDQSPANKLFLGAFQAVDPNGDKAEARRLWDQATSGGASAADVLPLLDGGKVIAPGNTAGLGAPPSEKQQAVALKRIKELFQADLKAAKTPERKQELSHKLLTTAADTEDPIERYVLAREALDLAATGGSAMGITQAVDDLSQWYKVDALELKAEALARAASSNNNATSAREIARLALELLEQALQDKRNKPAVKLNQAALNAARKSKDAELIKAANQRNQQVQESK